MKLLLIILITCVFTSTGRAEDIKENSNLIVIQKVASDGKSFVIMRGQEQKIYPGQKSVFSSHNVSFVARVVTSNNKFSQWLIEDTLAIVPFRPGEIVTISYSIEKVWTEIPRLIADKKYENYIKTEEERINRKFNKGMEARYHILGGMMKGLSESTTESENNETTRTGTIFKLKYVKSINEFFRWEAGFRYESDTLELFNPVLSIESQRYMVTGGMQFRFVNITTVSATPYAALTFGIGKSQSQVSGAVKTGTAQLIPSTTFGLDYIISDGKSFLIEFNLESVSVEEAFSDSTTQKTNITSASLNFGLEFH